MVEKRVLDVVLEEYRQLAAEALEYTKLFFALVSIMFGFVMAGFGLIGIGGLGVALFLQLVIIVGLAVGFELDYNIVVDIARIRVIEESVNQELGMAAMRWQAIVGYVELSLLKKALRIKAIVPGLWAGVCLGLYGGTVYMAGQRSLGYMAPSLLAFLSVLIAVTTARAARLRHAKKRIFDSALPDGSASGDKLA